MTRHEDYNLIKRAAAGTAHWPLLRRRVMHGVDGFGDEEVARVCLAANLAAAASPYADESTRRVAECAAKLLEFRVPTLYLAPDLARSVLRTRPPLDLRWGELQLPFEAALMIPPKNLIRHREHGPVDFVGYARVRSGETVATPERTARFADDSFRVFTALAGEPRFPTWQRTLTGDAAPTIGDCVFSPETSLLTEEVYESEFAQHVTLDDSEFLNTLVELTFAVLLAIVARPSLMRRGERRGRHKKSGLPVWTPNVVGRDYRVRSESDGAHPHPDGHARKRLHWRRGHFRLQPFGPGRTDRKIIWMEPVLVGGEET